MTGRKKGKKQVKPISTLLTTGGVASIFNVHPSTIRRWCEQGKIKSHSVGPQGERMFRREDIAVAYLDRAIQKYLKELSGK